MKVWLKWTTPSWYIWTFGISVAWWPRGFDATLELGPYGLTLGVKG